MKYLKAILVLIIFGAAFVACEENEVSYALQEISAPTDVSAVFEVAQDDSGTVIVTPSGEGAQAFNVYFGDVQNEDPTVVTPGGSLEHVYEEGEYKIRIVALGATGLTSEYNQGITISFSKPENLEVTIDQSDPNPKLVKVSASADNASSFDVYFGDAEDEEPTQLMPNTVLEYTYEEKGDYTIRVVAMGASTETVEYSEEITIGDASGTIALPITFDDPAVNYTGFIDGAFSVVDNPAPGGANDVASKVGAIENAGDAFEAIVINLGTPVDFSENKTIKMKLWSESSIPIAMKFEGGVDGERENEVVVTHGGTGWEDLTFDYATDATKSYIDGNQGVGEPFVPTGKYATMVIFVDFAGTTAGTFYIDDIEQPASVLDCTAEMDENVDPGQGDINWTFKSNESNPDNPAYFEPFGNIESEIVANPNPSGINESCNVQSYVKTADCETWSGVGKGFDNAIDLRTADNKVFKMMVYGESKTTKVSLQLEFEPFPNTDPLVAIDQEMTKVGEWEELTFDFSEHTDKTFKSMIVYFDRDNTCDDAVYYFDNIVQVSGDDDTGGSDEPSSAAPAPGQSQDDVKSLFSDTYMDETVDTWITEWSSATFEDVTIDGSAMKKYSALDFVGIETVSSQIDASEMTHFRTDVWSADFTVFKIKLVDFGADGAFGGGDDTEHEITIESPAQGEWVSLDIPLTDFTGLTSRSNIAQLIYVGAPSGENTVFIDNIYFYNDNSGGGPIGGTGPTSLPIDFETSETGAGSKWDVFEADTPALEIVANPDDMSSVNNSSTVAKFTAPFGGADYAGTVTALSQKFTLDASNSTVSIMVWKSVISDVGIKFESNKASSGEIRIPNTKINEWEEIVFDFSGKIGEPSSTDIDAIVVFPDFDARTQDNVVYFDNITLSASSGGPSGSLALPITFDEAGVDYEESIEGSFSVVDNPAPGGANNVASKVGAIENAGVNWEAIVANMGTPVDFGTNKTIKIKVWSTIALPILLKFEAGVSGERENEVSVNHSGTGWEELTFDFATSATKSYIDGNSGVGEAFVPTGQYAKLVLFVDGPGTAAGTFYIDDIIQE